MLNWSFALFVYLRVACLISIIVFGVCIVQTLRYDFTFILADPKTFFPDFSAHLLFFIFLAALVGAFWLLMILLYIYIETRESYFTYKLASKKAV